MTRIPNLPSYNAKPQLSAEDEARVTYLKGKIETYQHETMRHEGEIGGIIMNYQSDEYKADVKAVFDGTYDWSQVTAENRAVRLDYLAGKRSS